MSNFQASDESPVQIIEDLGPQTISSNKKGKKGDGLAKLMFRDPGYVKKQLDRNNRGLTEEGHKSNRHRYLEALIQRGEELETKKHCPDCQERLVSVFALSTISGGILVGPPYTSCGEREACKCKMLPGHMDKSKVNVYEFKFSDLRRLQSMLNKTDFEENIVPLFRWAFGVHSVRLTNKKAYDLFRGGLP